MVNYQIFSNVNLVRIFNSTCITLLEILNFLTENPIKCSLVFHLISRLGPVISSAPDNQSCSVGTRHKILDTINSVNSRQEMPCSAPVQVWPQYRQHQGSSSAPDWQPPATLLSLLWLTGHVGHRHFCVFALIFWQKLGFKHNLGASIQGYTLLPGLIIISAPQDRHCCQQTSFS